MNHLKSFISIIVLCVWTTITFQTRGEELRLVLQDNSPRSQKTFQFGTPTTPSGESLYVDSKGLLLNGKEILPVMGEIHYSRVPRQDWKRELLKMKAGGITIAATYVFWIHHEEVEGRFDWSGNKDLRAFVETCHEVGLPLVLRIGPFCHGEALQGGIPTWIIDKAAADRDQYRLRSTAPGFMRSVKKLYDEIAWQVRGQLWKDGGPIIGVQLENECRGPWSYYQALKKTAIEVGFDVPFYTRTGWPKLNGHAVFGEILPLYGDYADGFWDRKLTDMPGDYPNAFVFKGSRLSTVIATETFGTNQSDKMEQSDLAYPYMTCELGGGMMTSYHRRINIFDRDAMALAVCKVGSGSNLPGYYMYHGGTNPISAVPESWKERLGYDIPYTMAETQRSKSTNHNDMPIMSYDFQTPLGEVGQVNKSFHSTRIFHMMLSDWGEEMSEMDAIFPEGNNENGKEDTSLRWVVRSNGKAGFLFVNNYQRMKQMSTKQNVKFSLITTDGKSISFPSNPVDIVDKMCFVLPFGLEFEGLHLDYATVQPLAKLNGNQKVLCFSAINGLPIEISIEGKVYTPKMGKPLQIKTNDGNSITLLVLDEAKALTVYKVTGKHQDYLVMSPSALVCQNGEQIMCETWEESIPKWEVYPNNKKLSSLPEKYLCKKPLPVITLREKQKSQGLREVTIGIQKVAEMPLEEDFKRATVWQIEGLNESEDTEDLFLEIAYKGDVARVYADGQLVADNFWNGKTMWVRVADLVGKNVELKILPLSKDYPIYLQAEQRSIMEADTDGILIELNEIRVVRRNSFTKNIGSIIRS